MLFQVLLLTITTKRPSAATMSRLALIRLLVSLIFIRCLSVSATAKITVHGPLNVQRGTSASLLGLYRIANASSPDCTLMFLDDTGHHCGDVWPRRAACDDHTLAYSHYGCLNQYETLNFRVVTRERETGALHVDGFSMAVHIIASDNDIELAITPLQNSSRRLELRLLYPPSFVNRCSYSLVPNHRSLDLPFRGELEGPISHLIPCGQSPSPPFLYRPAYSQNTSDAIAVQTNCIDGNDTLYHVLPFNLPAESQLQLKQLPKAYLKIKELSVTPLPANLLELDPLDKEYQFLKLTFPVHSIGGLYPLYSSKKGYLDTTVFTYSDLRKGEIVFVPDDSSSASYVIMTSHYHYYVSDITGWPVAEGTLEVTTSPRLGFRLSLRKNTGMSLYSGGSAVLDANHLDFYPPFECSSYHLKILTLPTAGSLSVNETRLAEGDQLTIVKHNLTLTYQHNRSSSRSYDMLSVCVHCIKHKPFNVSIPIRIIHPEYDDSCTLSTIYGYPGYATPLHNIIGCLKGEVVPPLRFNSSTISGGTYYLLDEACQVSHFPSYPYIPQSDDEVWSECFTKLSEEGNLLDTNQLKRLWRLFSPGDTSTSCVMSLTGDTGNTISINCSVISLSSTPQEDFEFVSTRDKTNFTHSYPSLPWLRQNRPLTIHTLDATHITSQYLYVQTLGYLQSEIIYVVTIPPRHGLLCYLHQLQCSQLVLDFTQEDILTDRIYYKPLSKLNVTEEDFFEFDVYYLNDIKLKGDQRFHIQSAMDDDDNYKQFWVPEERSRPLLRKHLRHLISSLPVKGYIFTLLQKPNHGFLKVPDGRETFSWEEVTNRLVIYHHRREAVTVCRDGFVLSVSNGYHTLTANISIAIRRKEHQDHNVTTKQHKLEEGSSFTLSATDLKIRTGFCPEFVKITVANPPNYGLLIVDDPSHQTRRHLSKNATFLLQDINNALVSFSLLPDLTLVEDTEDKFLFEVEDPSGGVYMSQSRKREAEHTPSIFSLLIIIIPERGSGDLIEFNLTTVSPKPVTKLEDNRYGAILGPEDMYLTASDILPSEVHISTHQAPVFGNLEKQNVPIQQFTLADVYSNKITYISTITHTDTTIRSDEFRFSIYISIFNSKRRIELDRGFTFSWCYFTIDFRNNNESFLYVQEPKAEAHLVLRKIGSSPAFLQTAVRISTVSNNHTIGRNCSRNAARQLISNIEGADYCTLDEVIVLSRRRTKHALKVELIDDAMPKDEKMIQIHLSEPEGCLIPKEPEKRIYIYDYEDYSVIEFSPYKDSLSIRVPEDIGTFNVTLVRTGNLNIRVGVVCYTKGTNESSDYVHRPNSIIDSIVYFYPGQSQTVCPITIIDDRNNEPIESFLVKLGEIDGYGFLNDLEFTVYIEHDIKDEPVVFFPISLITVQESSRRPVTVSFKIQRVGFDLQEHTSFRCYILPNGNASKGTDFQIEGLETLTIPSGATETTVDITVFNDSHTEEGPEVFRVQMTDPYFNGRLGSSNRMEVVILDAKKDIIIGFPNDTFEFQETDEFVQVPLHRHGNLNVATRVFCQMTLITADQMSDVWILPKPEKVEFPVNTTNGACSLYIIDDRVREKGELLRFTVTTNDPSVQVSPNSADIVIVDPEDAPHISFTLPSYSVKEPLSNNLVDSKTITLPVTKTGDTSVNTTIFYRTANGTAKAGLGFIPSEGELKFAFTDNSTRIFIIILADQHELRDTWFSVILFTDNHGDDVLTPYNITRVTIKNTILGGVFFPSSPIVLSVIQNGTAHSPFQGEVLSSDRPVTCVTPCDIDYTGHTYHSSCNEQNIDPQLTLYDWELSPDGSRYSPVSLDTILTSVHSRVLQPVYFKEGVWLRCRATAVDSTGLPGYSRTSAPVLMNGTLSQCNDGIGQLLDARLTTYASYSGRNEDLLLLEVTLPDIANTLPVVTTSPPTHPILSLLTHPLTRAHYPCSTVSHDHEFLFDSHASRKKHHDSLPSMFYRHHDAQSCRWKFSLWIPTNFLSNQCSAQMSKDRLSISLTLFVQYARITNNSVKNELKLEKNVSFVAANIMLTDHTSIPFGYNANKVSEIKATPPFVHPIAISQSSDRILLVLRSHNKGNGIFLRGTFMISGVPTLNNNRIEYLFPITASTVSFKGTDETEQTWLIEVFNVTEVNSFDLILVLMACPLQQYHASTFDTGEKCSVEAKTFSFSLSVKQEFGVFRVGMRLQGSLRKRNAGSIETSISLDPSLILTSNDSLLSLTAVTLCGTLSSEGLEGDNCFGADTVHQIMEKGQKHNVTVSQNSPVSVTFLTNISHIIEQENSIKNWYFNANCSLQSASAHYVSQDILIPIPQSQSSSEPSPSPTTPPITSLAQDTVPVYATVLISIMLGVFTVASSITGLVVCYTVRKRFLLKKFELEMAVKKVAAEAERERERAGRNKTVKSYKKKHVGRHYPQSKSSFQLLMNKNLQNTACNESITPPTPAAEEGTPNSPDNDEVSSISSESLKQSPKSSSLPTLFFSPSSSVKNSNNSSSADQTLTKKDSPSGKDGGNRTLVATVRPISVRPFEPTRTLSVAPIKNKSDLLLKPFLSVNRRNQDNKPVVANPGWYERHLAREKAMAAYSRIYLSAAALPKPSDTETSTTTKL